MVAQAVEKTRGEGPMIVNYVSADGKTDHKRVPADVIGVHVVARKDNSAKTYLLADIPEAIKQALAAKALANAQKIFVANHDKGGDNVISLSDKIYSDFVSGKLYTRAEGGAKPGKKFDPTIYVQAAVAAYAQMAKRKMTYKSPDGGATPGKPVLAMTEQDAQDMAAKLEAMTPKERSEQIKKNKRNTFFDKALTELQAKAKKIDTDEEVEELF
jgi:hypothetical protein